MQINAKCSGVLRRPLPTVYLNQRSTVGSSKVPCHGPLLKWRRCSLRSTESAKCSIYKSSQGESEARGERVRGDTPLDSRLHTNKRSQIKAVCKGKFPAFTYSHYALRYKHVWWAWSQLSSVDPPTAWCEDGRGGKKKEKKEKTMLLFKGAQTWSQH